MTNQSKDNKIQDSKYQENIDIKQLEENYQNKVKLVLESEAVGLEGVVMPQADSLPQIDKRLMQEHHNSGHALWFLGMVVYGITHENPSFSTEKKAFKTLAHLICLREFVSDEAMSLRKILSELIDAIQAEAPIDHASWTKFIYSHWNVIRELAEHYGHAEKCFPNSEFEKIQTIVTKKGEAK